MHGMNLMLLRPDRSQVLPSFLHYALRSESVRSHIRARCKRAINQASINQKELRSIPISVPELSDQQEAVDLLSRAENIVRMRREAEQKAKEIIPALFLELFGDPATNPKGWKTMSLNRLGKIITGTTPPSRLEGMFGGAIPFVTPGDLERSTSKTARFVTEDGAAHSRTVRAGSTLVCCIGATIGKTDAAEMMCAFNQQINAVEWNDSVVGEYGTECLREIRPIIVGRGSSTALPILKKSLFESIQIPVPPRSTQCTFAALAVEIKELVRMQQHSQVHAVLAFQSLLAGVFGETP